MSCRAPGRTCCAGRSRSPRASGSDACSLLLKAAKRLEPLDVGLARETYLDGLDRGPVRRAAGRVRRPAGGRPRRPGPAPGAPSRARSTCCWTAWRCWSPTGTAAAAPTLRQAVSVFPARTSPWKTDYAGAGWLRRAASALWDDDAWHVMLVRQLQLARRRRRARAAAAPARLAGYGRSCGAVTSRRRAALVAEADAVCEATGSRSLPVHRDDARGPARGPGRGRPR